MSGLYEFWFDVIKDGRYLWEIERMHEKYGPIVRINVRELHIRDSQYYSTIYAGGARKINKDAATAGAFGVPFSVVATVDHYHHRARRAYLNPYFSKRSIADMEFMMHERIGKLCERFVASIKGEVVSLDSAFAALTADIITQRFYGQHFDYLDIPDYKIAVTEALWGISTIFHVGRFIPGLASTFRKWPIPIIRMILRPVADLLLLQEEIKRKILSLDDESKKKNRSVLVSSLGDPSIPTAERTIDRLLDEGLVILIAGTETSSRVISVGMFYLLNDKSLLKKLREELKNLPFQPDNEYSMSQLKPLPYLTGVVNESLRLSLIAVARFPRVAINETLQYDNFAIPPGTPVSQSTYFVHTDPTIYPNPYSFDPDRWARAAREGIALHKFLVSFSKGSRQCIGIQMALTEIYLTIARLVLTFDMDLHETTKDDVKLDSVRLIAYPKTSKNGAKARGEIMVKVTGRVNLRKI